MAGIPTEIGEVFVQRVANGWCVQRGRQAWSRRASPTCDETYDGDTFIARTPKELADLLAEWATRQQDAPPKG